MRPSQGRDHSEYGSTHILSIQRPPKPTSTTPLDVKLTKQPKCHGCERSQNTRMFRQFLVNDEPFRRLMNDINAAENCAWVTGIPRT